MVLKYFRHKVSPALEEEYHRYRVTYNRMLQWRFANARSEASMAAVKQVAQVTDSLLHRNHLKSTHSIKSTKFLPIARTETQRRALNAWARITAMRNLMAEKRALIQKQRHAIKTFQIMQSEMRLLEEWSRIERRNTEAVGRVARKLSAISVCLPLVHDALVYIYSSDFSTI